MLKKFVLPVLLSGALVLSLPVSALAAPNTSSLVVQLVFANSYLPALVDGYRLQVEPHAM